MCSASMMEGGRDWQIGRGALFAAGEIVGINDSTMFRPGQGQPAHGMVGVTETARSRD